MNGAGQIEPRAATKPSSILVPGRNCWRVERSSRTKVVQDAADYYALLRTALLRAQHSVFVLGWDILASLDLLPGGADDGEPTRLVEVLDHVVRRRRRLQCHVLVWDHSVLHALERDPFTRLRFGWLTHRRLHFRFDDRHPIAASHHAKVVVVDDEVAFCGGIDLTTHRWDTAAHRVDEPLRKNVVGSGYGPYHDVQTMVEGPAAAALGEHARERWRRLGWRRLPPPGRGTGIWPDAVASDFPPVDVAIARTSPRVNGGEAVREVEALFVDSIAAARRSIYLEQQYFTDVGVCRALAARLREADGPEVVVVSPGECSGWLEQNTMGALRERVFAELRAADRFGRLRLVHPMASVREGVATFVHAKVTIVDDEVLRVGSANLASRSMGVDTECDLAIVANGDPAIAAGIRSVRARLLAEHTGREPQEVLDLVEASGSWAAVVDRSADGDRALLPIEPASAEDPAAGDDEPAAAASMRPIVDPIEPLAVEHEGVLPEVEARPVGVRRLARALPATLVALAVLAAGIVSWANPGGTFLPLADTLRDLPSSPVAHVAVLAGVLVAGLAFVPLSAATLLAVMVLGPWRGIAAAVVATLLAAMLGHRLGAAIGPRGLAAWIGPRAYRQLRTLHGCSAFAVAGMRLVPVASATTVHLLCGAARVPFGAFVGGTALGIAGPVAVIGLVGGLARAALLQRDVWLAAAAALAAGLVTAAMLRLRRRFLLHHVTRRLRRHHEARRFG